MKRIYLNDSWYYTNQFHETMLKAEYDFHQLETVRLPHTNYLFGGNYTNTKDYQKQCLYIRTIPYEHTGKEEKYILTIEAAAHYAKLYVNGNFICDHRCGYTSFHADITDYLKVGNDNVVAIFVDSRENLNQPPFGATIDYATFGGIYREVYLDIKPKVYMTDLFFETCHLLEEKKYLKTQISVNQFQKGLNIRQTIMGLVNGKIRTESSKLSLWNKDQEQQALTSNHQDQCRDILTDISLWSVTSPVLYEVKTELLLDEQVLDERIDRIGFREIQWKNDGLYLNGEKIKIRGLNRHQSFPYVGYAMPKSQQRRDAEILKWELGVNAVRTSHYPQSRYFLDRCDELGLLVFTEIPGWQHIGDEEWQNIACENVKEMVLQYRNHPSIILWGVRINESEDLDTFYKKTNDIAHDLDPTRATGGVRCIKHSHLYEDVYTYNDFCHEGGKKAVEKKKKVTKDNKPYLISEFNGHMFPTKSFDQEERMLEHALRHARVMNGYCDNDDILGGFGWCMFDYQTHSDFGSGDCICYHGVLDMFRNPKLAASVYQSQQEELPVLEVSSSMDVGEHPGSVLGPIYAFTNADHIKLYKNDQYITTFDCKKKTQLSALSHPPVLIDDMIGEQIVEEGYSKKKADGIKKLLIAFSQHGFAGITLKHKLLALKLMAFDDLRMKDAIDLYSKYVGNWGQAQCRYRFEAVKEDKVVKVVERGPIATRKLWVHADHVKLCEDTTYDVAAIQIRMLGDANQLLRYEQSTVKLTVSGKIELIGPDTISLLGGMSGTYIKTCKETGEGTLKISSQGVEPVSIHFQINKQ